jgi:hypothetical protein
MLKGYLNPTNNTKTAPFSTYNIMVQWGEILSIDGNDPSEVEYLHS